MPCSHTCQFSTRKNAETVMLLRAHRKQTAFNLDYDTFITIVVPTLLQKNIIACQVWIEFIMIVSQKIKIITLSNMS